ncbi:aromatic ring-hydroxylating dioxygenase subunit alpha [Maritimibacter sp. UBA3975]|uniref:aromatic ring-hydroxylating dioxygenase subunit alpha n=1 Tax=Maritimibacter sp. UBA3975 TaxID=1946833 RepID=UPI000C09E9D5|nr:aromatic ring-hydroxylating dioxygenase subunit alpha [Maritimibacter sp. UBA3975]MAM62231.1 3-phenylpropionate dioxygenase [Maritimibacter sp.]|tara:strand:- start:19882 stop:21186 length:1305 start_codon:yes stop_codon:yes gene_type:complete
MAAPIEELVDLDRNEISPQVYCSEEVYRREVETIFAKSWLLLGHESQVPKAGDFFTSSMAEDPVVVVRQRDGSLRAFLNQCRHRGMRVCRSEVGSARSFMCPYHGWTYGLEGDLKAVPHEEQYGEGFDKQSWGLRQVTRLETYKGLIFGCWDEDAVPIEEYLGDSAYYLDQLVDRLEGGTEVIGGVHKWLIDCNWKMPAEQFASDMYHAASAHVSAVQVFMPEDYDPQVHSMDQRKGAQFWTEGGHGGGYFFADTPNPAVWVDPVAQDWLRDTFDEASERLGRSRAARVSGHNTVFPNMSWLNGTNTLRVWHPRGPNQIEVWAWVIVDTAAPVHVKDAFRRGALRAFGPSGMLEQDDGENWVEVQKVLRGSTAAHNPLCYGMLEGRADQAEPDSAASHGPVFSDNAARNFYRRWLELMTGKSQREIEDRGVVNG